MCFHREIAGERARETPFPNTDEMPPVVKFCMTLLG